MKESSTKVIHNYYYFLIAVFSARWGKTKFGCTRKIQHLRYLLQRTNSASQVIDLNVALHGQLFFHHEEEIWNLCGHG